MLNNFIAVLSVVVLGILFITPTISAGDVCSQSILA